MSYTSISADTLKYYTQELKKKIKDHNFGICETEAEESNKIVDILNYELIENGLVSIKFINSVPAAATLNINQQGNKSIFFHGEAISANIIKAGNIATFIYDGENYIMINIDEVTTASSGTISGITATFDNNILYLG